MPRLRVTAPLSRLALLLLTITLGSCAGRAAAPSQAAATSAPAVCRTPAATSDEAAAPAIAWIQPVTHRAALDAWCSATGRPVVVARQIQLQPPADVDDELVIVSWNLHVGTADLAGLVRALRAGRFTQGRPVSHFVLLLQEAYRDDDSVPVELPPGRAFARALGRVVHGDRVRTDVVALAEALGLSLYYVPSMRNGAPGETREDRGNAVLSTEPLTDLAAIELPFEKQRRVAVAATVAGRDGAGRPYRLRVASVHLESTTTARRLWVLVSGARVRQARGLLEALQPHDRLVVGGDFNTWFGFKDETYQTVAASLTDVAAGDRRRTFGRLFRLDHVFAKLPAGWTAGTHRLDERWGSDHYPLLTRVRPDAGDVATH